MNGVERVHFEEIESTNTYIKTRRNEGKDLIVTATAQTGGRGTKGRSFSAEKGGVYLSKLSHYTDFPASQAFKIMIGGAVAVCKTLEHYGLRPVIKWPNDIHVNGKKICGILIENVFSGKNISSSVVGIGVNVCNLLPDSLDAIATSMLIETGKTFDVEEVTRYLIAMFDVEWTINDYHAYIGYMGREVTLILGEESKAATLRSVDGEGGLWAEIDGKLQRLTAAEVSVRF